MRRMDFPTRVRVVRAYVNETQEQFGKRWHVCGRTVMRWEMGQSKTGVPLNAVEFIYETSQKLSKESEEWRNK